MYNAGVYAKQGGDKLVVKTTGVIQWGESVDTVGLLAGGGTGASPLTTSEAGKNFFDLRTQSTDATGADSRGLYWRHYLAGAGGSGETGRLFTTVTGVGAVAAHGLHASVSLSGSGTIAGQATGVRATLHVPDAAMGGTVSPMIAEVWADGGSASVPAASNAFIRCVLGGTAGGVTTLNGNLNLLSIEGVTIGNAGDGKVVDAISGDKAVTHLARIRINGAAYYLMLRNAV